MATDDVSKTPARDEGAAAVETALVMPFVILLLCGIIDFGLAFHTQLTLSHAARESARVWALGGSYDETQAAAQQTAVGLNGVSVTEPAAGTGPCTFGSFTTVTLTVPFTYITPWIASFAPGTSGLTARGVMRCGG